MEFFTELQARIVEFFKVSGAGAGVFVAAGLVYLVASRGLHAAEKHWRLPEPLVNTLRRITRWGVTIAAVILLLQSLGVLQSVFAAVTGVLALVAIGFVAVWSVLSNTLCSLILMISRPFRVGDTLAFPPDDFGGRVVNFNLLFTSLETDDGCLLQVPNNVFFQRVVVRKKGVCRIPLADQLYREENARFETAGETATPPRRRATAQESAVTR